MDLINYLWQGEVFKEHMSRNIEIIVSKEFDKASINQESAKIRYDTKYLTVENEKYVFKGQVNNDIISGFFFYSGLVSRYAVPVTFSKRIIEYYASVNTLRTSLIFDLVFENDKGLTAKFINQDRNQGIFYNIAQVDIKDVLLSFIDKTGNVIIEGTILTENELEIKLPIYGKHEIVIFKRYSLEKPPLTSIARVSSQYSYEFPKTDGTDLASVTNKDLKIDTIPLQKLIQDIANGTYPNIHALLLLKESKLLLEEYFYGYSRNDTHDLRSAGKTLASILTGILIEQGMLENEHIPVFDILSEYRFPNLYPEKSKITVAHLLSMSSGLHCNDFEDNNPGNEEIMYSQEDPDWTKFILTLPSINEPGKVGMYCTGGVNVIGAIIRKLSGTSVLEFADLYLFKPLNITNYHFNLTPAGDAFLGGGIQLQPIDMAKLGQLYQKKGVWNGVRIVSYEWITKSWSVQSYIGERAYGYNWWHTSHSYNNETYTTFSAEGNGGQFILVNPELDIVMILTGGNYFRFPIWSKYTRFISKYILPSILQSNA